MKMQKINKENTKNIWNVWKAHTRSSQKFLSLICYRLQYGGSELLCVEVFKFFQVQTIG